MQKILLQGELTNLGVQLFEINHGGGGSLCCTKHIGSPIQEQPFPISNLRRMQLVLLSQLSNGALTAHRFQRHLGLEGRAVFTS